MPLYHYKAVNINSKTEEGDIEAGSSAEARLKLEHQKLSVLALREKKVSSWNITLSFGVSAKELSFFTKNLSVMMDAGLPVIDSLIITEAQSSGKLGKIVHTLLSAVESGSSLADAMERYPRVFSGVYVDVVRTGELSGQLARNLQQLAIRLEHDLDLRRKIQAALFYPMIIVGAVVGLLILLVVFVLPRLDHLFSSIDIELPATTRFLLWSSDIFTNYWLLIVVFIVGAVIGFRFLLLIHSFKALWHRFLLHVPIISSMIRNVNMARITGTLGSLLKSGVPMAEALQSVIHAAGNYVYQDAMRGALQHVEEGGSLAEYIDRHHTLFTHSAARMIAVGERTGRLDSLLLYLANYFEVEVDASTKQLSITIEPVLLLIIGGVVIFIGLSVITPVYEFTATAGRI